MKDSEKNIFHFNPTCEIAIANNSPYYQAPALLREFEEELATIMLFFASKNDHVLKEKAVTNKYLDRMAELKLLNATILQKRKSHELIEQYEERLNLHPWGWSPAEHHYLSAYKQNTLQQKQTDSLISANYFERRHAVQLLTKLIDETTYPLFPTPEQLPVILNSVHDISCYLNRFQQIVLKSPLSSSGRGLQIIRKNKLNESNKQWINTILKQQKYIVAEPLFDNKQDLSFQFEFLDSGNINYHGVSYFKTTSNGQYLGHLLNASPKITEKYFPKDQLKWVAEQLKTQLEESSFKNYHRGFLSIDSLIYKDGAQYKIQPCIEINPRYNMGILSKYIEKRIHPFASGIFQVYYHPKNNYHDYSINKAIKNPPLRDNDLLKKGFISLTDSSSVSKFGAYLELF